MTQSAYTNATINNMLGWLKGFAGWVLKLFNLAGSEGFSPLQWLADNWLQLLIILLAIGVAADLIVWLIRWRPHWVWLRKRRILIEDEDFFAEEDEDEEDYEDDFPDVVPSRERPRKKLREGDREFVVPSTVVRRSRPASARDERREQRSTNAGKDRRSLSSAFIVREEDEESPRQRLERKPRRPSALQEDEVFNVSDLPVSEHPEDFEP